MHENRGRFHFERGSPECNKSSISGGVLTVGFLGITVGS